MKNVKQEKLNTKLSLGEWLTGYDLVVKATGSWS